MKSYSKNNRILVTSPTFTTGSWMVIEELLNKLPPETSLKIIGLGPIRGPFQSQIKSLPYFTFDKLDPWWGSRIVFNSFYQIPLLIWTLICVFTFRPKVIISNGFTPLLLAMFITKFTNIKTVVYFGSVTQSLISRPLVGKILPYINKFITNAFVNSQGSFDDLKIILDGQKITIIEHWTDMTPLTSTQRKNFRLQQQVKDKLVIVFVGRFVPEKWTSFLIEIAKKCKDDNHIHFWFAGTGVLKSEIEKLTTTQPNVTYQGFITDRLQLKKILSSADITFSFADVTYLARPAIESLACATPIMIPNSPALLNAPREPLHPQLVPPHIGWLINPDDSDAAVFLLKKIKKNKSSFAMRPSCQKYAQQKYSSKNLDNALQILYPTDE